jgi:hypothetical protein
MHVAASRECDACMVGSLCCSQQQGRVADPATEMLESEEDSKAESREGKVGGGASEVVERGLSLLQCVRRLGESGSDDVHSASTSNADVGTCTNQVDLMKLANISQR